MERTMANSEDRLGGHLPLVYRAELGPDQKAFWDKMDATMGSWAARIGFQSKTSDGRFIGPFNPMLRSSNIAQAFLQLQADEEKNTDLTDRVRQVLILSVGSVWRSPYELYAHTAAARRAGLSERCVAALVAGETAHELAPDEAVAQRLALALAATHVVEDNLYAEALRCFGEKGLVDFAVLVGCYELVCGLLNLFSVPAP
jgi:4-carboxymuconolactone decarboxylase